MSAYGRGDSPTPVCGSGRYPDGVPRGVPPGGAPYRSVHETTACPEQPGPVPQLPSAATASVTHALGHVVEERVAQGERRHRLIRYRADLESGSDLARAAQEEAAGLRGRTSAPARGKHGAKARIYILRPSAPVRLLRAAPRLPGRLLRRRLTETVTRTPRAHLYQAEPDGDGGAEEQALSRRLLTEAQ